MNKPMNNKNASRELKRVLKGNKTGKYKRNNKHRLQSAGKTIEKWFIRFQWYCHYKPLS